VVRDWVGVEERAFFLRTECRRASVLLRVMRCERVDAILGSGGKMEVLKTATKTDQTLLFYFFFTALSI